MSIIDVFNGFWRENKEDIIHLYKCSLLLWEFYENKPESQAKRVFRPIKLHLVHDNEDNIIFVAECPQSYDEFTDIFWGFPIATIEDGSIDKVETHKSPLKNHYCDGCECILTQGCYICSECNYDLCDVCFSTNLSHNHDMFRYNEYWGMNTYERSHIVKTVE